MSDSVNWFAKERTTKEQVARTRLLVLKRVLKGHTITDIAADLGLSIPYIAKLRRQALADEERYGPTIEHARRLELMRLDRQEEETNALLERAKEEAFIINSGEVVYHGGKPLINLEAQRKIRADLLDIQKRRAALLGLDRPNKVALTDPTGEEGVNVVTYLPDNGRDNEQG